MISQYCYIYCDPTQNVQNFLRMKGKTLIFFLEVNILRYNDFFFMDLHLSNILFHSTEPLQEQDGP